MAAFDTASEPALDVHLWELPTQSVVTRVGRSEPLVNRTFSYRTLRYSDGIRPWPYMLNRYSRVPGTQPQEYEYRNPPG